MTLPRLPKDAIIALIVGFALLMELTNATVISTALPKIAESLGEDPVHLSLAITAYLISLGVFIPLSGWMADRYGARRVFCLALIVFTLGAIACSLVNSLGELVAARILQGAGGAMMVPVGRLVLLRTARKDRIVEAMSYLTIPALLGPMLGPPIGGYIATYYSWRWIFLINVPICAVGLALVLAFIPEITAEARTRLDRIGFVLIGAGLALSMFGFELLGRGIVPLPASVALLVTGLTLLLLYVLHMRRVAHPIVNLRLLAVPTFRASTVGGFAFRMGIGAIPFLVPLMLQLGFGYTPFESGLITFSGALGALLMKFSVAPTIRAFGFRRVLVVNAVLSALFMAAYGVFRPETAIWIIVVTLFVGGIFRSIQFTALNSLAYADIPQAQMSQATTFASVAQQLSLSLGVGVGAMMLHFTLLLSPGGELTGSSFAYAFFGVAAIMATSAFAFLSLGPTAGEEITGRKPAAGGAGEVPAD